MSYLVNPTTWSVNEQRPVAPIVSPDGRWVLVISQRGVLANNTIEATIWAFDRRSIVDYVSGVVSTRPSPKIVSRLAASSNSPIITDVRWLDPNRIAFLGTRRHAPPALFIADVRSGTSVQITPSQSYVTAFDVRGDVIAYATLVPRAKSSLQENNLSAVTPEAGGVYQLLYPKPRDPNQLENADLLSVPSVLHVVRNGQQENVSYRWEGRPLNLYAPVLSLSPNGEKLITIAPVHHIPASWEQYEIGRGSYLPSRFSPKDRWATDPENPWKASEYVIIDLKTGFVSPLLDAPAGPGTLTFNSAASKVIWSKDGARAIVTNVLWSPETKNSDIDRDSTRFPSVMLLDINSGRAQRVAKIHSNISNRAYLSNVSWIEPNSVLLSYAKAPDEAPTATQIYRLKSGTWISQPTSAASVPSQNVILSVVEALNIPPRFSGTIAGETRTIWDPNPQLQHEDLGEARVYSWRDQLGHSWSGILVLPPHFDPKRRYPLVIQTHGYREDRFFADGIYTTGSGGRALSSADIVVLQIGLPSDAINTKQESSLTRSQFSSAVKSLDLIGIVDPSRVGAIGFSYTCYSVLDVMTHLPDLLATAAITDGNNKSYLQYLLDVDIGGAENPFLKPLEDSYGGSPHGVGLNEWGQEAPGFNLYKVRTPLLISSLERGTLLGQWEIYAGLRAAQKPVDMEWVPSQRYIPHVLVKPLDRLMSQQMAVDWFRFWLQGYEDPTPAKRSQYKRWEGLCARQAAQDKSHPINCAPRKS